MDKFQIPADWRTLPDVEITDLFKDLSRHLNMLRAQSEKNLPLEPLGPQNPGKEYTQEQRELDREIDRLEGIWSEMRAEGGRRRLAGFPPTR